jgi:CheY-like chemotaxis protein
MSAKRALIVDDSKSARMFLSRILEKYELDVDTTETRSSPSTTSRHHRPDVIFMDHLMPGMDGFQALQAIKNNPQTATIPIMMYTSQEGELYLGQARALGAVGVLPKQIKQRMSPRCCISCTSFPTGAPPCSRASGRSRSIRSTMPPRARRDHRHARGDYRCSAARGAC